MASPSSDTYDPLLPILWMTMRQHDDNNDVRMNVISNNMTHKRKRHRSSSLPFIESVSSVSPLTSMNIAVHLDGKDDTSLESNSFSSDSHCSTLLAPASNNSLAAADEACQSNTQENTTKNRQFLIEVPGNIEISPAVLFRQLAEKFASLANDKNEDTSSNYLIRPKQSIASLSNIIFNISTLRKDIDGYGFQSGRVKDKGQDVTNEDINTTHYVILYPKDRNRDPDGDVQSSLQWKTRIIITSEQEEQTFFYAELNENDYIKLTKKNSKRKLLYNNELCQLEFRTTFKVRS
ncbi:unnamed protein product [Rotaria sp. Silwood2]|nr:unnamed protein product [Rotaria sp. Silwood2]